MLRDDRGDGGFQGDLAPENPENVALALEYDPECQASLR